jgi:hypothetical protein
MSKPVDDLTMLKILRIKHLESLDERMRSRHSDNLEERLKYLREGLAIPVSDKIITPNGTELTKEQFQEELRIVKWEQRDYRHRMHLEDWTIPSLDGIKFNPLYMNGHGPITVNGPHYERSSVQLTRCRIRTLGSVEFPPVVHTIALINNDITDLRGVIFPPCMHIWLGGNLITSLHGCTFSDEMPTLLDLQHNLISSFEDLNVAALPKRLSSINLEGNPIADGLSADEIEELHRKVLYRIMKERNRAKRPGPAIVSPPPASAPSLEQLDEISSSAVGGVAFDGFGGSKQKRRSSIRKLKRKKRKTNKMNKSRK